MSTRWCRRCRSLETIEWTADTTFGAAAESARCPACGAVWGVRERRKSWIAPLRDELHQIAKALPRRGRLL